VLLPQPAADHYQLQQRIGALVATVAGSLWARMDDDFDAAWRQLEREILAIVTEGQEAAARTVGPYLEAVLFDTEQVDLPAGDLVPTAFAGTSGDGRDLDTLLYGSVTTAKRAVEAGYATDEALARGGRWLTLTALTAVADANREAVQAGIGFRPAIAGWVRMLNPPSCSRCIILAGKWFRWNEGFQRHPRCDCRHIPAGEQLAGDLTTDPYEAFQSMTKAEQDREFGRIGARAIRDGGDIYRIVNIQQRGLATARAAAKWGTPSRMTIDDIYRTAGNRTNAVRMMTEQGYITGPQTAGGTVLGAREGFGELGRGGTRVAATTAVRDARITGVRDPLNRYTMTAAERRLYDAHLMRQTVLSGRNPWLHDLPLSDAERDLAERIYLKQVNDLPNQPRQVHELARRLGIL
jgi:hypothetical protein